MPRIVIVYAIVIPLALLLGFALTTGLATEWQSEQHMDFAVVGLVLFVLVLPVLLKWHHNMLIFFWNAAFLVPFLPARTNFWLLLAVLSFGISWLTGLLGGRKFLRAPELTRPLLFLGIVVLATGIARGGIGTRALRNSSYGGRAYFLIFSAIIGYFALSAVRIPVAKASRAASIYFLSGVTSVFGNLAFMLGPAVYFLFYFLPSDFTGSQQAAESGFDPLLVERLGGFSVACTALVSYFLVRWGLRGILSYAHPWRSVLFVLTLLLSLLGGFRSVEMMLGLILVCQICCEGLWRTRFLPIMVGLGVCGLVMLFAFAERLPMAAQRAVSFLPVKVDAGVKADAESSTEWRLEMWRLLVPQIPQNLLVGKGYAINPDDLFITELAARRGEGLSSETAMLAGDYHSGPLSTIIPLGLWGAIGLLWLLGAGIKALYQNLRYGDPALHNINVFFLAVFIAQSIHFFMVFGAFDTQLYTFTGILGLSVSINGGVRKRAGIMVKSAGLARPQSMIPAQA